MPKMAKNSRIPPKMTKHVQKTVKTNFYGAIEPTSATNLREKNDKTNVLVKIPEIEQKWQKAPVFGKNRFCR